MISVRVNDATENVPELKRNSGQGLVTTVWAFHTGDRLDENDITMLGVDGDFLVDFVELKAEVFIVC